MGIPFAIVVCLVSFVVLLVIGLPLGWGFLLSTIVGLVLLDAPMGFMAGTAFNALYNYLLMAIGFFILAGMLMSQSGIADGLVRLSRSILGNIRGGMTAVGIMATLFLSALTGSSLPCISVLIPMLVPRLEKFGYHRRYTTTVLCASSFLGYLIPPSVPVLIYCVVAGESITAVFLSTVIPGILLAGGYLILNYIIAPKWIQPTAEKDELPSTVKGRLKEVAISTWVALPAIGCPVIVLGGIYGGVFTPSEAGAIAVIYTLVVGIVIYKRLSMKVIWGASVEALTTLGMFALLVAFATVFTRLLVREGVAVALAQGAIGLFAEPWMILLMMNIFILILGMFIDGIPILLVITPLILPLVAAIDLNMVQLGAILVVNVGIGVITPPYSIALFVGSRLSDIPYTQLVKPILPFILFVAIPVLLLTTYIPAISLWLPTLVLGPMVVGPWR
ncbi:MAG: TRAP transporter large permease [Candidatus Omnitrophica bacterium]|nr:TRAP transporter large permease [Candidatus Omnitrophota bacterium]